MPTMAELAAAIVARQELPPEQGDMGPTGPQGKAGLDGSNGRNGDPGPKGATGDRGPIGANGADGRNGADGKDGVNGEPGLVWRGPWVRNLQYWADDAVEQDGSSYVCTVATRSKPPSGAWDLLAKRGATGPPGMSRGGGGGGGGSALTVKDEGVVLDTAVGSIDFVGDGVTATAAGHSLTVTIPGGGGSQDLEAVLTAGNDGGALDIVNVAHIRGLDDSGATGAIIEAQNASFGSGGELIFVGGDAAANNGGAQARMEGGTTAKGGNSIFRGGVAGIGTDADGGSVIFQAGLGDGAGVDGRLEITTDGSTGAAGDVLTAQGDSTALWAPPAGGSGVLEGPRPPTDGTPAQFLVDYLGATAGGATWLVNGNETVPITFDANEATIAAAIEAADPTVVGFVNVQSGPPWTVSFAVAVTPVTLDIGVSTLSGGSGPPTVSGDDGTAADLASRGTRWIDTDNNAAWTNYGTATVPQWQKDGDVTNPLTENLAGDGFLITLLGGLVMEPLSSGGSGILADEYNVTPQDGLSAAAAIIAGDEDPSAGGGISPDYTQGSLFLRNPDDVGVTPGSLWVKTGTAQGEWTNVLRQAAFVEPTTATPEAIALSLIAAGLMAAA